MCYLELIINYIYVKVYEIFCVLVRKYELSWVNGHNRWCSEGLSIKATSVIPQRRALWSSCACRGLRLIESIFSCRFLGEPYSEFCAIMAGELRITWRWIRLKFISPFFVLSGWTRIYRLRGGMNSGVHISFSRDEIQILLIIFTFISTIFNYIIYH